MYVKETYLCSLWLISLILTITSAEHLSDKKQMETSTKKIDYDNKSHESINVPLLNDKNNTHNIVISEGGITIDKNSSLLKSNVNNTKVEENNNKLFNSTNTSNNTISLSNNETKISHSSIIPRKGVDYDSHESMRKDFNISLPNNTNSLQLNTTGVNNKTTNSTEKLAIPKKPTVTTGEDEPYAPSHFVPQNVIKPIHETVTESPKNSSSIATKSLKKIHVDMKKNINSEPEYLIPLVISILIIPALLGMFVFIYKYGQDWWDRRHYRRMDYLIEGMYNN